MRLLPLPLVVVLGACGGGHRAAPATPADDAVAPAAQGVVEQWRQAWETRSVEALAPLYSHDLDVVVVDQGTAQLGWTAVETYLSTRLGGVTGAHLQLDGVQTTSLGAGGVVVNASLTRELDDAGGSVTERGALTLVLRARPEGGWAIVTEHFSRPPSVD